MAEVSAEREVYAEIAYTNDLSASCLFILNIWTTTTSKRKIASLKKNI